MIKFTLPADGPIIAAESDILDPIGNASYSGADTLVIPVSRLSPDFFKLSTGLAGAILQHERQTRAEALQLLRACARATPRAEYLVEDRHYAALARERLRDLGEEP